MHAVVPLLLVAYAGLGVASELSLGSSVWAWIATSRLLRLVSLTVILVLYFTYPLSL